MLVLLIFSLAFFDLCGMKRDGKITIEKSEEGPLTGEEYIKRYNACQSKFNSLDKEFFLLIYTDEK